MKRLFAAAKKLISIDKQRKALRLSVAESLESVIKDFGWVKWYGNTWRHKDYPDLMEGFTTEQVINIINVKYNEIKDINLRSM